MADDLYTELLARSAQQLVEQRLTITVPIATPSAGSELSLIVPGGVAWGLISFQTLFNASAVVATRTPSLRVVDPDNNTILALTTASSITANGAARVGWYAGLGAAFAAQTIVVPLPTPLFVVPNGYKIQTVTGSLDVGDQWSQGFWRVVQFSETDVVQACDIVARNIASYLGKNTPNG